MALGSTAATLMIVPAHALAVAGQPLLAVLLAGCCGPVLAGAIRRAASEFEPSLVRLRARPRRLSDMWVEYGIAVLVAAAAGGGLGILPTLAAALLGGLTLPVAVIVRGEFGLTGRLLAGTVLHCLGALPSRAAAMGICAAAAITVLLALGPAYTLPATAGALICLSGLGAALIVDVHAAVQQLRHRPQL